MALDQYAVLTLGDAQLFLGKGDADTADDQLLDMLIQQASKMVVDEIGTGSVVSKAYKEYHDGHGGRNIWLNNFPVTGVDFISTSRDDAMTVSYDGDDSSYATVEVTSTELQLRKRVSGVLTASAFTLEDYATLTLLEAAVEAVAGWTVVVSADYATYAAASLSPVPAKDARDNAVTLGVPDQGEGACELANEWGRIYNPYGWTAGHRNVYIEYTAGWPRSEIPQPIRSACLELVKMMYDLRSKDGTVESEKIGEYSYKLASNVDLTKSTLIAEKLANYRRPLVMGA